MISRVADHLFWLGRYLERAESSARVCLVTRNLALDGELEPRQAWQPAVIVSGEEEAFRALHGDAAFADGELVQHHLTWQEENLGSLVRSVAAARENARSIRDQVSLETWEAVNELHLYMSGPGRQVYRDDRHGFYRHVRQAAQMCLGVVHGTMLHDDAFDFIMLGVYLERAGQTARILDVHHHALSRMAAHQVVEVALWLALLRACSGFEPFMKRFQGKASPGAVARFLVLDARFPRSVNHCLHLAAKRLARVRAADADLRGQSLSRLRALESWVVDEAGAHVDAAELHELLTHVVDETHAITVDIGKELFGYAAPDAAAAAPG
ncbi:MAG: alpha-E domain-containing protein [Anaeromyxobacter sp.]|nr:alpha-E domain-containing protein [Anaeromyxobacter sp.]MBL0274605.1 alpha-E domain-containing protein [Anaeromyxobacter sp.]